MLRVILETTQITRMLEIQAWKSYPAITKHQRRMLVGDASHFLVGCLELGGTLKILMNEDAGSYGRCATLLKVCQQLCRGCSRLLSGILAINCGCSHDSRNFRVKLLLTLGLLDSF